MTSFPQHRPVTLARRGMVAAPHYLAAEAGLELLKTGGNAIDAAIAASATLQVVYPFVCGLGGDVFCNNSTHKDDDSKDCEAAHESEPSKG